MQKIAAIFLIISLLAVWAGYYVHLLAMQEKPGKQDSPGKPGK
jgi:hypothetical protein